MSAIFYKSEVDANNIQAKCTIDGDIRTVQSKDEEIITISDLFNEENYVTIQVSNFNSDDLVNNFACKLQYTNVAGTTYELQEEETLMEKTITCAEVFKNVENFFRDRITENEELLTEANNLFKAMDSDHSEGDEINFIHQA